MANQKIEEIEGIGPESARKLAAAGIADTDGLLEACCTAAGRKATAEKTGLSAARLLKWANMADLFRIKGVGSEYAELLERSGVDTVKELGTRNPESLVTRMTEVNLEKKLTRRVPDADAVRDWVEQAKSLPAKISH